MSRTVGAALMTLASAVSIRWLWLTWTPRCNETCAQETVQVMYGLILVSMLVTAVLAVLLLVGRLTLRRGLAAYGIHWTVLAISSVVLTP